MSEGTSRAGGREACELPRTDPEGDPASRSGPGGGSGLGGFGLLLDLVAPVFRHLGFGGDGGGAREVDAVRQYIESVRRTRLVFVASLLAHLSLLALFAGFMVLHIALAVSLPWSPMGVAALLFALGGLYLVVGTVAICYVASSRFWARLSGAGAAARKAVRG